MKYARIALGLMVALGMMTSTVLAQTTYYSEGFEGASLTNVLKATGLADTSAWSGGVDDISSIVAGTPTEPDTFGYPKPFKGTDHNKVLQLDTEGGTLTNALSSVVGFAAENIYVDTMIKFVPSEDKAVIDDNGVKVAVYAYAAEDGASTNLAIYHGAFTTEGYLYTTNTITGVEIDASQWYRLTIILADDDGDVKDELVSQAMQIYLNGNIVTGDNAYTGATGEAWTDVTEDELLAGPSASGIWFVSACSLTGNEKKQIGALQFRGTGFVDDLTVANGDPFVSGPLGTYDVTQTVGAGGSGSDPTSPIKVTVGQSTNLTYTANEFYRIASLTVNGTAVEAAAGQQSYLLAVNAASAIVVSFSKIDTYAGSTIDWFIAQGWKESDIVGGLDYAKLEMLNVAATNANAGGTITITAIEVVGTDVLVTVFIERQYSLGAELNGVLKLYGTDSLATGFTVIGEGVAIGNDLDDSIDNIEKVITYQMAGGKKFYKAQIEAPAAQP